MGKALVVWGLGVRSDVVPGAVALRLDADLPAKRRGEIAALAVADGLGDAQIGSLVSTRSAIARSMRTRRLLARGARRLRPLRRPGLRGRRLSARAFDVGSPCRRRTCDPPQAPKISGATPDGAQASSGATRCTGLPSQEQVGGAHRHDQKREGGIRLEESAHRGAPFHQREDGWDRRQAASILRKIHARSMRLSRMAQAPRASRQRLLLFGDAEPLWCTTHRRSDEPFSSAVYAVVRHGDELLTSPPASPCEPERPGFWAR